MIFIITWKLIQTTAVTLVIIIADHVWATEQINFKHLDMTPGSSFPARPVVNTPFPMCETFPLGPLQPQSIWVPLSSLPCRSGTLLLPQGCRLPGMDDAQFAPHQCFWLTLLFNWLAMFVLIPDQFCVIINHLSLWPRKKDLDHLSPRWSIIKLNVLMHAGISK